MGGGMSAEMKQFALENSSYGAFEAHLSQSLDRYKKYSKVTYAGKEPEIGDLTLTEEASDLTKKYNQMEIEGKIQCMCRMFEKKSEELKNQGYEEEQCAEFDDIVAKKMAEAKKKQKLRELEALAKEEEKNEWFYYKTTHITRYSGF